MALPPAMSPWPPIAWQRSYAKMREWAAWYGGDPNQLANFYGGTATYQNPAISMRELGLMGIIRSFWWGKPSTIQRVKMHIPMAADLATRSGDMLFSEPPEIEVTEEEADEGTPNAIQERIEECAELDGWYRTFLEGGEVAAALRGVYLRATWDNDAQPEAPMLTLVHPDSAIPQFDWGRLRSVCFWRVVAVEGDHWWRHLEVHEPGWILHGLYRGTTQHLGDVMNLNDSPVTRPIMASVLSGPNPALINFSPYNPQPGLENGQAAIATGIDQLTAAYIPNMMPSRNDRGNYLGRSDFEQCETLFDSLDEVWSSWIRDIRLARGRLIVAKEFLRNQGPGQGATMDMDQELWVPLPGMNPKDMASMITPQQFNIRVTEHQQTAQALVREIVTTAGYSPATFGVDDSRMGAPATATEVVQRERATYVTRGKKIAYWTKGMSDIVEAYLALDQQWFGGPGVGRPRIDFADNVQNDPDRTAATIQKLHAAEAISIELKVRMREDTDDWSEEEINNEIKRIKDDYSHNVANPYVVAGAVPAPGAAPKLPEPGALPGIPASGPPPAPAAR